MSTALRASARRQLVQLLVERALRDLRAHNASPGQAADPDHDDARIAATGGLPGVVAGARNGYRRRVRVG